MSGKKKELQKLRLPFERRSTGRRSPLLQKIQGVRIHSYSIQNVDKNSRERKALANPIPRVLGLRSPESNESD